MIYFYFLKFLFHECVNFIILSQVINSSTLLLFIQIT